MRTLKILKSIEINNSKETVRATIAGQVLAAARDGLLRKVGKNAIVGLTLPGDRFLFESQLQGIGMACGWDFRFDCAEMSRSRFEEALRHKPQFCGLAMTDFHNLLQANVEYDDAGVAKRLIDPDETMALWGNCSPHHGFVWADYCCVATDRILEDLSDFAIDYSGGPDTLLMYATFSIPRCSSSKSSSHYDDIDRSFLGSLKDFMPDKDVKVKQVLSIRYSGGENYFSHMYTLGFAIGCKANKVTPINLDLRRYGNGDNLGYHQSLAYRRQQSIGGKTDYGLSPKNPVVMGKALIERMEMRRKESAAKNRLAMRGHSPAAISSAVEKDAIEKAALAIIGRKPSLVAKQLNRAVLEAVKDKFPNVTIRNVSATVTTRVTHRETFAKGVKGRRAA